MAFTKYIKNNTASSVTYVGNTIAPGAYYLIQAQEDANFSTDPDVLTDVANTNAIMATDNSGSNDISDISEAIDFLKNNITRVVIDGVDVNSNALAVNSTVSVQTDVATYSSAARVDWSGTTINLPRQNQTHATVYTYSGSGLLSNILLDFNSQNVEVILEVDGNEIINVDIDEIDNAYKRYLLDRHWMTYDKDTKTLSFSPEYPIVYSTSVSVKARANSNSNGRRLEGYIVDIVKST